MVCSAEGKIVFRAPPFREGVFFFDGEAMAAASEPLALPEGIDWVFSALKLGLGDYLAKSGFDQVVLGLSGGIDSAVVAALAAETLGPEKVLGVMMPSRYSSEHSIEDSEILGRNLGIGTRLIPIERPFCSLLDLFSGDALLMDLAEENLQARIRGIILMFISNRERRLVLPTGNKSELSVGYSTLYGDMCGGLSVPVSYTHLDVYKRQGDSCPLFTCGFRRTVKPSRRSIKVSLLHPQLVVENLFFDLSSMPVPLVGRRGGAETGVIAEDTTFI